MKCNYWSKVIFCQLLDQKDQSKTKKEHHIYLQVLPIKGQRAANQRVEDDAETPDVHLGPVILFALEKLGGGVRRRAAERVQLVTQRELVAEAEVGDLDVHVGVEEQVLRLGTTVTSIFTSQLLLGFTKYSIQELFILHDSLVNKSTISQTKRRHLIYDK